MVPKPIKFLNKTDATKMADDDDYSLMSMDGSVPTSSCRCIPCGRSSGVKFKRLTNPDEDNHRRRSSENFIQCNPMRSTNRSFLSFSKTEPISISEIDKVPMHFSHDTEGKIITDPLEAQFAVKPHFYKRKTNLRTHSPDDRQSVNIGHYSLEPWFHSAVSREDAEDLVKRNGSKEGTFLVRTSHHLPGCYIISLMHNRVVHHFPVTCVKDNETGIKYLTIDHGETKFRDLVQLVEFYQVNAGSVLPTPLKNYVTKAVNIKEPNSNDNGAPHPHLSL